MRFLMITVAAATLAACSPPVPDSGQGVGFGNYDDYQQQQRARDAQLADNALPPSTAISGEPVESDGTLVAGEGADLAAETQAVLDERSANSGEDVVHASPSNPAPEAVIGASGISEENNFDAVGAQRSIESDAAKIAQNRAQYKVIEAEALPKRTGNTGPNIVDYALATKHPRGTQVYRRIGVNLDGKAKRNCAKYPSADKAQGEFLAKGGPQRDRLGLDPDGDGYACSWDPSPFRKAVGG
ncbi:hypothetical protein [Roseovarius aestuarii]|uniref:Excalibur calcium-binding domain-containing protein n=1 Tax=Roseovarius aestuarii TaxID=475083 RepID=A0A1X7BPJ6_9RHOB|nr:hypothetical protein [Roseovarius aestuarii]SMC11169.1 hypothetical protein ROA7745_00979 [Roseovarius aestuarii]